MLQARERAFAATTAARATKRVRAGEVKCVESGSLPPASPIAAIINDDAMALWRKAAARAGHSTKAMLKGSLARSGYHSDSKHG